MTLQSKYPYGGHFRMKDYLNQLQDKLSSVSHQNIIAFSCCCCERLYPTYKAYADSCAPGDDLRAIIDELWAHVLGASLSDARIGEIVEKCKTLELKEEHEFSDDAIDAVDAVWLTIDGCISDSTTNAAKAAERCLNRIDRRVQDEILGQGISILTPSASQRVAKTVFEHPLFHAELEKQQRQVEFLMNHSLKSMEDVNALLDA